MICKTCDGKGMLLKSVKAEIPADLPPDIKQKAIEEGFWKMEVVTCDCCGGWSADGLDCDNCLADAEGRPRPIAWTSEAIG